MRKVSPKVGARRLRKLADFLETKVRREWFDMNNWASDGFPTKECGSTACALGWATIVWPKSLSLKRARGDQFCVSPRHDKFSGIFLLYAVDISMDTACNFFGLATDAAKSLFIPTRNNDGVNVVPYTPKQQARRLRAAANKLERG